MRKVILGLICCILVIADNVLMPFLSINGGYASLLFIFVICYSFINDYKDAVAIGIFSGLLQDIYMIEAFGVNALTNMLLCVFACKIGENIFKEKRFIPVISTLFLTLLKGVMIYGILYIFGIKIGMIPVLVSGVYSMVICFCVYKLIYKFCEEPFMKKQWRF